MNTMDKIKDTVVNLILVWTLAVAIDQPVYALAKQIQWLLPDKYVEKSSLLCCGVCILKWRHSNSFELSINMVEGHEQFFE